MLDDQLFRWNLTINLKCEKCNGTAFVEEVVSSEIFCATCGDVLAKSQDEWPSTWNDSASFGTAANGKSRIQRVHHVSRTINNTAEKRNPITSSLSASFSPTANISTASSKRNTSTTSLESSYIQRTSSSAFQIEESITVQLFPHSLSQQKDPPRIPNTPNHAYDDELILLSEKLSLPEVVVLAAKRIILRLEAEPRFIKQYPKSNKNFLSITLRAALFAACRQLGIPKTFKQIELDLPQHRKPYFHKIFKFIDSTLKRDALTNPVQEVDSGDSPTNAFPSSFSKRDFILSQVKTMGLSDAIRNRAISISECDKIENVFSGKRANVAAAVILSFAAECEERYLGSAPYAEAANVGTSTIALSQKVLLKAVKDMSTRGELPPPFRARWNYPNYKAE